MPKTITKQDFEDLLKMRSVAKFYFFRINKLVKQAEKITKDRNDYMFDFLWSGGDLKKILKEMGVKIEKETPSK